MKCDFVNYAISAREASTYIFINTAQGFLLPNLKLKTSVIQVYNLGQLFM